MTTNYRFPNAISRGSHASPADGACVMEMVSLFAGEPFSDHPACACPVITEFAIRINDRMPDDATRTRYLGPMVPLIAVTRRDAETEQRRMYIADDYAVRVFAPLALEVLGMTAQASALRALPRIHDRESALLGRTAAYAAADAAAAAATDADAYAAYAAAATAAYADYADYAAAYAAAWEQVVACIREMCETE